MRKKRSILNRAIRNNYGFVDATPGTDIASRLNWVSESTIRRYIRLGWLRRVGIGLVLTHEGYQRC
jgi:hypothetical protein